MEKFMMTDLNTLMPEIPADTIVSRTFYNGADMKGILFGFAPGQELSEHTAAKPAVLHFLRGEADVTLGPKGGEQTAHVLSAGAWVHMDAYLPHSVVARTEVVMLLTMIERSAA